MYINNSAVTREIFQKLFDKSFPESTNLLVHVGCKNTKNFFLNILLLFVVKSMTLSLFAIIFFQSKVQWENWKQGITFLKKVTVLKTILRFIILYDDFLNELLETFHIKLLSKLDFEFLWIFNMVNVFVNLVTEIIMGMFTWDFKIWGIKSYEAFYGKFWSFFRAGLSQHKVSHN